MPMLTVGDAVGDAATFRFVAGRAMLHHLEGSHKGNQVLREQSNHAIYLSQFFAQSCSASAPYFSLASAMMLASPARRSTSTSDLARHA